MDHIYRETGVAMYGLAVYKLELGVNRGITTVGCIGADVIGAGNLLGEATGDLGVDATIGITGIGGGANCGIELENTGALGVICLTTAFV
jgi:hypothetical protein